MEPVSRVALLEWLEERRVEAEFKVSRILGNHVIVEDREGNCAAIQGDWMVIALGAEPVRDLVGPLKRARCPVTGNWR